MIEPATAQNPAVLYPYQIAELRGIHGSLVDQLMSEGVIVEKKGEQNGNSIKQN